MPVALRKLATLLTFFVGICLNVNTLQAQSRYGTYGGGFPMQTVDPGFGAAGPGETAFADQIGYSPSPVVRGRSTAHPLPQQLHPDFRGTVRPGAMVHPSASPYLFRSGTSNQIIQPNAFTTASFEAMGVNDLPAGSVQNLGYQSTGEFAPLGGCSTCLSDSCSGCSTGACSSLGDLMPYNWLQAVGGEEYGVSQNWYTNFGFFAPLVVLPNETGLTFLQANGLIADDDTYGANVGLVTRRQDLATYWFFGSGLWYDFETRPDRDVHQLGISLEALSRFIEVRANGYLPLGSTSHFATTTPQQIGNNLLIGYDELSLAGADIEGGIRPFEIPELWFFLGYYFYTDLDDRLENDPLEGLRGRAELRPSRNLTMAVTVSHDDLYKTQVYGSLTLSFGSLADLFCPPGTCNTDPQFTQLVTRKSRITTTRQRRFARSATTGNLIVIAQASSSAASGGDGSPERPFDDLQDAVDRAGEDGIIFVRDGTFDGCMGLLDGQRLLADGFLDTNPHVVSTQSGVFQLPGQRNRADVVRPTITSDDPLGTIRMCPDGGFIDNVEITGFEISNTVGSGIVGFMNDGLVIRDNVITGNNGFGIALFNPSGDTVNSPTAPASAFRIQNNEITSNNQGGILIADVDLNTFDLSGAGVDLSTKGISFADRGPLDIQITGNTISDNAATDTSSVIGASLSNTTLRDDRFGVQVVGLTDSTMNVSFDSNTIERNGTAAALGRFSSAGGISVLAGGSSTINASVTDTTLNRNAGTDIQGTVGDGPATTSSAQLNLTVERSTLQNAQLSETDDGVLAAGIRLISDEGSINATIDSVVILGDTTVLNSTFDRMEALYAVAELDGQITTNVISTGLNPLGRTGNELIDWHVGAGSTVTENGVSVMNISDALIDAECVLKFHSGEVGDGSPSSLTSTVTDSVLLARLAADSPLDAVRAEALGGASLGLTIQDSEYRFEGLVNGMTPDRAWLAGSAEETSSLTFLLDNSTPQNSLTGFTDFLNLRPDDSATITATIRDTTIGETMGQGIDIEALDSTRVTLNIERSILSNSGTGLLNVQAFDQAIVSSTLTSNTLTNPANRAITLRADGATSTDNARVGATLTSNQFQALSGGLLATSDADDGLSEIRLNMTDNTSNGLYLLEQLETAPGSATFQLFDGGGNSPTQTTTGTITSSGSLLDITFP